MQNDIVKCRIPIVAMSRPPARPDIHLDVSRFRGVVVELYDRPPKIRSAFNAAETRMQNFDRHAVRRFQFVPQQPLMLPHRLQQIFRRALQILPQQRHDARIDAPTRVEARKNWRHTIDLRRCLSEVKPEPRAE